MARQEEGWPLGLQPLNFRVGLGGRARDYFGSISFNTMLTGSSTPSTDSSSDLDTESTGSFFHDRSITLGSLIGVSSILELSRRSIRGRRPEPLKPKKPCKSRIWLFSLCSRHSTDVRNGNPTNPPSLGHFLAVERRASTTGNTYGRTRSPNAYQVPDEILMEQHNSASNSLFVNGQIAPPPPPRLQSGSRPAEEAERSYSRGLDQGLPVLLSCVCGQAAAH